MIRPTRRAAAPHRPTKWCRRNFLDLVQDEANLVVGDGFVLCPITTAIDTIQDVTIFNTRIIGSLRRTAVTADLSCMWVLAIQKFNFSTGVVLQFVNPYNTDALSSQDIMGMGFLDCPPTVLNDVNTPLVNREGKAFEINVKAQRKLNRNTHTLVLTIASRSAGDVDGVLSAEVVTSTLMKF